MTPRELSTVETARTECIPRIATRGPQAAHGRDAMAAEVMLVVPCFNEEPRLPVATFDRFAAEHPEVSFVFVNDGSTDGTSELLAGMHAANPAAFRLLDLDRNCGKGEAVRQGMLHALGYGPDYVGYWDADLATPLEVLADFRLLLNECPELDLVMGSRVPLLGRSVDRRPCRQIGGRVFATAAALVLGVSVYDTQCGAKLFRVSDRTVLVLGRPFCSRWAFDVELLARLLASRGGPASSRHYLYEYPLPRWTDVAGSKMRTWHMVQATFDLARIFLRNRLCPYFGNDHCVMSKERPGR